MVRHTIEQHEKFCRAENYKQEINVAIRKRDATHVYFNEKHPVFVKYHGDVNQKGKVVRSKESVINKMVSFAQAAITGKYVSDDIKAQRIEICKKCEWLQDDACGICKCKPGGVKSPLIKQLTSLAAYVENLPKYGCKHPKRGEINPKTGRPNGWPLPVIGAT